MKNKKGFTLIELLSVIAILAILVILTMPKIIELFNDARKNSFLTEVKTVYNETTSKYLIESLKGNKLTQISSDDETSLNLDGEKIKYFVLLDDNGNVDKMAVGNGSYYVILDDIKDIDTITIDDIEDGTIDGLDYNENMFKVNIYCTYDGSLTNNAKYINGQYTYIYNTVSKGWSVNLTDKNSLDSVTTALCKTINDKPIVSMSYMFSNSKATSINLNSFDTSNVIYMSSMFSNSKTLKLDLSTFDTSKVIDMTHMFYNSKVNVGYARTQSDANNFNNVSITSLPSTVSFTIK